MFAVCTVIKMKVFGDIPEIVHCVPFNAFVERLCSSSTELQQTKIRFVAIILIQLKIQYWNYLYFNVCQLSLLKHLKTFTHLFASLIFALTK